MARVAARPDLYAGIWFRSRLEVSWAAFLDHHAVKWKYETEFFDLGDGIKYQPDFWLPESRAWLEVKGVLDAEDEQKMLRLARRSNLKNELVIIAGAPAGQVFGEVMPDGTKLAIDMVRCRHCDRWTFSMMMCRACEFFDGANTFDDVHSHLGGPCKSRVPVMGENRGECLGTFGYDARGLREMLAEDLHCEAEDHAHRLGIRRR